MSIAIRDKNSIWHPFTRQKNMADPIAIVKGKGSLLFDEQGNSYIDAISSWWVNLHGHAHPYIAEKLYQQALELEQVIFAGFTHRPAVELAERLLTILPGNFSRIFYSDNGSTSTEVALKMAIQYWWNQDQKQRNKLIAFKNSYHGDTFGAMSVSDRSVFTLAFHELLFDVVFLDTPTQENISELKTIMQQHAEETAAFIYEPLVQGAGGMNMYDPYLLNELLNTAKLNDIICIADEVMTGFGRTGKFFASDYMNKKPDIICLSKGLTGGTMALGVTACTDRIYQAYVDDDAMKTFFHGHSFTANPLACTAALASLDLLQKEECLLQIEKISAANISFADQLRTTELPIKDIRSLGTILAFEIDQGKKEYLNQVSSVITKKALDAGMYIRPLGNTVYIMPPYCIEEEELEKVYKFLLSGWGLS
ncbi:MAG: adenosylmethionine--8-amino-7-oxononanoate transaminase [Sediminibacterium sp.]|jgi:adenosylmethionine---8-amino-7-oxononanoate aminotransferase|uniref:adenosylmethionine--8-amino-7-oxononanoate transaminase n=1 Tax=Sediminibacterium sp. TaxID=1917865 RepID=UPI002ABAF91A|nr:adenosylmethionine--8-amino-7-oxononanoate transaminase [Sediminibacterium sp.]MDZ4072788.1 adenosylmethionine--8-amino-7-oxononanoate transaminase [Sediminibacterium sp.]